MALGLAITGLAASLGVGLILLIAGIDKWRHRMLLPGVIANYRLLPTGLVLPAAKILPIAEIGIGGALIVGFAPLPVILAILLLTLFGVAMAINIRRGRTHIDCGCGRSQLRHPVGWPLVARNAVLAVLLFPRLWPAPSFGAMDIGTAMVGGVALYLAYLLCNSIGALIASPAAYRR
ncbi:methylamine utilization protein MauE [Sphingobium sp. AS12]|uniref:MauE/DoxX family redox-associated membrane protein n=1 Tax=Sphingobium sp. AS12 TaxID=2849495 RepID=UPI001C315C11|nr:MauE/DoxX family redox-associated membrane protein [Sphingobium sp. AS12]MBV2150757.1 methylamine utilization protein MauE [Sphingobium sp. AS12]